MRAYYFLPGLITLSLAIAAPAHAGGVYIGGGVGDVSIQDTTATPSGVSFDESDIAWKAFAGYRFDALPIVSLSGEVGYRDLGSPSATVSGVPVSYNTDGFDYSALVGIGLGPVEVFGRVGGMNYTVEKNVGGTRSEFDGNAPLYGIGARLTLFGIGLQAEYEYIDINELDTAQMISVSALYQF
jgi:hypothetical protein